MPDHAPPPSAPVAAVSLGLLVAALVGVVGLAKVESPTIGAVVAAAGLPHSFVGVVIALLVLLPETLAAVRNAARDRVQVSFNLAFGSAMASIGLTIPDDRRRIHLARRPGCTRARRHPDWCSWPSRSSSASSPSYPGARPCSAAGFTWSSAPPSCSLPFLAANP